MEDQVGEFIRHNIIWAKLPPSVQQIIGTPEEYDKKIVEYSVRNQLRYRGNIVRHIKKNEKGYYEQLLKYSREHLMLFPYHLSDFIVTAMRITPFQYYILIMNDLIDQERSYDTLPNFTAADCLRLLGIGRNQYIEIMNQCRSTKKFLSMIRKPPRDLLPSKPVKDIPLEPWWLIYAGYITEDDVKLMVSSSEKSIIDTIIDDTNVAALRAGNFNEQDVRSLYLKGLIYLDVPIEDDDLIVVPPLEGFVMNRVTGDYFETLLYKTFISIDENTPVAELASILQTDLTLVKMAVSMYCRLGFAYKKSLDLNSDDFHPSWRSAGRQLLPAASTSTLNRKRSLVNFFDALTNDDDQQKGSLVEETTGNEELSDQSTLENEAEKELTQKFDGLLFNGANAATSTPSHGKRIALLYDSTLAAFLMMGNLSTGLKSHAVTMFEVGKLPDESIDSLLSELSKISNIATEDEGSEAERYFLNAVMLFKTIKFLRYNRQLTSGQADGDDNGDNGSGSGVDLIRCESLLQLDPQTCQRLLQKNYKLLISIAPFSKETRLARWAGGLGGNLPHLGPPSAATISPWFKLFIYEKAKAGPPTLLLAKGTRVNSLPAEFANESYLLVTPFARDPATIVASSALFSINEALTHSALLVQGFPSSNVMDDECIIHVAFPLDDDNDNSTANPFASHPVITTLIKELHLNHMCGYISLINDDKDKASDVENGWTLFDCNFGVPLFDRSLNREISERIINKKLCHSSSTQLLQSACERLCAQLDEFIKRTDRVISDQVEIREKELDAKHHYVFASNCTSEKLPSTSLLFRNGRLESWPVNLNLTPVVISGSNFQNN